MIATLRFAVLAVVVLGGLAGAATLAQSPTPSPPPIPTWPAPPDPLPAGCAPGASLSPSAPNAPSGLWLEEVANPNLPDSPVTVVVLRWNDNSADELCFAVERRVGDGPWEWLSAVQANQRGTYGDRLGNGAAQCYRVFAGNDAGRSAYSNEACIEEPAQATATPIPSPVGCNFPTPTLGPDATPFPPSTATVPPAAPSDLRAELVPDPELESGLAVEVTWRDNADNETCYLMEVWVDGERVRGWGVVVAESGSTTGVNASTDIPDRTGMHCYRVYYGNNAGRAYSNEACVNVEVLPVRETVTPPTVFVPTYPLVTATPPNVAPALTVASPAATATPASAALLVPRALPATGGGIGGTGLAWWWALAAAGSTLLVVAAASLMVAARRRP